MTIDEHMAAIREADEMEIMEYPFEDFFSEIEKLKLQEESARKAYLKFRNQYIEARDKLKRLSSEADFFAGTSCP